KASAVDPAKPARILSLYRRRSFLADAFRTSWPRVTCPSPAITTLPSRRTQITVVERIFCFIGLKLYFITARAFATLRRKAGTPAALAVPGQCGHPPRPTTRDKRTSRSGECAPPGRAIKRIGPPKAGTAAPPPTRPAPC